MMMRSRGLCKLLGKSRSSVSNVTQHMSTMVCMSTVVCTSINYREEVMIMIDFIEALAKLIASIASLIAAVVGYRNLDKRKK